MRGTLYFIFSILILASHAQAGNSCKDYLGAALDPVWVLSKLDEIKSSETPAERRVRDATANYGFEAVALNNDALKFDTLYTKTVYATDTVDQEMAGTCWIFAQLNVYRTAMVREGIVLPEFKFSTNYVHFFDMLEKSNTRLVRAILATEKFKTEKEVYKQVRVEIDPVGDGGYKNYLPQLVERYGLVPYEAMPDTYATKYSDDMIAEVNRQVNNVINRIILKSAELAADPKLNRTARMAELLKIKEVGMSAVAKILVTHLGHPPVSFDVALRYNTKKDGKVMRTSMTQIRNMDPREFARTIVKFNKDDFVVVSHMPALAPGYYVVKRSAIGIPGAKESKHDLHFLNLPSKDGSARLQEMVMRSIDAGVAVEFAADVSQDNYAWYGALDPKLYDRDGLYGLTPEEKGRELTKREELLLGQTAPVHAMAFTGYDARDGADKPPRRFLTKNSWGIYYGAKVEGERNKSVQDGDFHMARTWFEKYVFEISVPYRILNRAEQKLLKEKPKVISYEEYSKL